jgi:hypothetical protein
MGLYTRDKFYMWAVHGHCLQLSDSFLSSDLRACAGLAGFPGPKSEFGRGGVRVHRRPHQNQEKWIDAGAYPEMARRLKFCALCAVMCRSRRRLNEQICVQLGGLDASWTRSLSLARGTVHRCEPACVPGAGHRDAVCLVCSSFFCRFWEIQISPDLS